MIICFVANPIIFGLGYDTAINNFTGAVTSKKVNNSDDGSEPPDYYTSDWEDSEALQAHEDEVCQNLEAEGAALLKNENNALPLSSGANVSLFSISSYDFMYGGTGSGEVDTSTATTLSDALTAEGFNVNSTLRKKYKTLSSTYARVTADATGGYSKDYSVNEAPVSELSSAESSYSDYGDAAIVTLARSGGEGADLPYGTSDQAGNGNTTDLTEGDYLRLTSDEVGLLNYLKTYKTNGTFKKIIVLLNSSNSLQLDFLEDYGIDAVLWVGDVGQTGITSVAKILSGEINPSGRIVDTFLKDNHSSPAMQNFGVFEYSNTSALNLDTAQNNQDAGITKLNSRYVVYEEGIYVGYKYYETRYEDYVMGTANVGDYNYSADVAYPFGSGLSYTTSTASGTWDYSDFTMTDNTEDDTFDISVKVTNNTGVAGKHTVQIYMQSPYTTYDINNKVEKASVELVGFDKTAKLANGESEIVNISVAKSEMASYDSNGAKTYIVDPGTYYFTAGRDSHDAINNILAKKASDASTTYSK
ncbi:MAG: glycoside hydrolase family 3 C-terminal domain-containing protein, partial [Prevotella sp.]|nr:glycoside hydrolase family 3 C-terminal domain-containing protein [Prevotella sp.]